MSSDYNQAMAQAVAQGVAAAIEKYLTPQFERMEVRLTALEKELPTSEESAIWDASIDGDTLTITLENGKTFSTILIARKQ